MDLIYESLPLLRLERIFVLGLKAIKDKERPLAQDKPSREIRDFLVSLHKSYLPNIEEMRRASSKTGLSLSTVNQAVNLGKGSAVTHGLLICYGLKLNAEHLAAHLPKFRKIFSGAEKISVLEEKIQAALRAYSLDEMLVWLEVLLAKDKIERKLGLKKRPGRPKKGS